MKQFKSFDTMLQQRSKLIANERFIIGSDLWEFKGYSLYPCDNTIDVTGRSGLYRKIGKYTEQRDPYIGKSYLSDTGSTLIVTKQINNGMYHVDVIKVNGKKGKGYSVNSYDLDRLKEIIA